MNLTLLHELHLSVAPSAREGAAEATQEGRRPHWNGEHSHQLGVHSSAKQQRLRTARSSAAHPLVQLSTLEPGVLVAYNHPDRSSASTALATRLRRQGYPQPRRGRTQGQAWSVWFTGTRPGARGQSRPSTRRVVNSLRQARKLQPSEGTTASASKRKAAEVPTEDTPASASERAEGSRGPNK